MGVGPQDQAEGNGALRQEIVIDPFYEGLEALDKAQGAIIQDPESTERYFWRERDTSLQREIWRPGKFPSTTCIHSLTQSTPGDGDGDMDADLYAMPGPNPPPEKRWRFFQSRVGPGPIEYQVNEPPKYVILDDRAAQELLASNVPRTHLPRFWSHDFVGNGSIRARRLNRGRGAIGDFEAEGQNRFHFATIANKRGGEKYYFKGENDYKPVIWNTNDVHLAIGVFKPEVKRITSPPPPKTLKPNQHGHNQFTPQDEMVKYGADHKAANPRTARNRVDEGVGGVRGGRNRAHNFITNHTGSPTPQERVENWRATTGPGTGSEQESSPTSDNSPESNGRKRPRRQSSEEDQGEEEEAYVQQLEMYLVQAKELTDEQNMKIDALKGALSRARDRIRSLEEEPATPKQD